MYNRTAIKLPSWLPGGRFKRYAQEWYPLVLRSIKTPYDKVKRELVSVAGHSSFTTSKMHLFRRTEQQLPLSPQIPYLRLTRIQPRKTDGSLGLSLEQCILLVLTP